KSLRIASFVSLLLATAVVCYSQPGHGAGGSGHMGGAPAGMGAMGAGGSGRMGGARPSGMGGAMGRSQTRPSGPSGMTTAHRGTQSVRQARSGGRSPQQLLNRNSRLSSNLQKLLPAGTTPQQACSGFTSLGRCVAAIHVSHNLGIPFPSLKNRL